jgi:alpha-L-rhamnosidase
MDSPEESTMKAPASLMTLVILAFAGGPAASVGAFDIDHLQKGFVQPPDEARIMMRWWWFGPAVTTPQLEREMRLMKAGGIGGFEVQPTYPLALDNEVPGLVNLKFLSSEFLDALGFTAAKAKELGLRFDLTLGSGWPYGGPQFSVTEAAGRLRIEAVTVGAGSCNAAVPPLGEGERFIAAFVSDPGSRIGYKEVEIRDHAAQLPGKTAAETQVIFLIAGHTGMKVKRAAFGAEGFVIDHYDPAVIDKFIETAADPEIKACGSNPPYAVFCDSLEVDGEDWTEGFLDEFKKRRGYDLRPWLPALTADVGDKTKDIRHDWGKTLTELYTDRFSATLQKWAKVHGSRFRIQAYGTPPAALYSYASADLCEGEGYAWNDFCTSRWAASASHLLGRPVTSSETWTWLHSPVFRATPLDMKAEADLHFLQGINQLIGHGWPYTAEGVEYPGWRFYAAGVFNEKNPWWIVMPDVAGYLQRVSFMLRQGRPANDVALYLADSDAWASFVPGRVEMSAAVSRCLGRDIVRRILESGYNLDFFDDGLLDLRGTVDAGTLAFGDVKYPVVVLAGVERIPPATIQKLEAFANAGGILIATRRLPALAPGLLATDRDHQTVRDIARRLFKDPGAPGIFLESEDGFGEALNGRLTPDVRLDPAAPEVGFVHRTTGTTEVYFLANTGNTPKSVRAAFRATGPHAEIWDPMTGKVGAADVAETSAAGTVITVDLEPYGSRIIVLTPRTLPARAARRVAGPQPAIDLSGAWSVTFGNDVKPVSMDRLRSWTEDEATRFFSGVAKYERKFSVPAAMLKDGIRMQLSLGEAEPAAGDTGGRGAVRGGGRSFQARIEAPVREAAVVYVNGRRAGAVWCPPYAVDVTSLLKAGENQVRVEVANLAVNDMAGRPLPDYRALNTRYGERFQAQDMEQIRPVTSGLLGPVRLVATAASK